MKLYLIPLLLAAALVCYLYAEAPQATKVEPPSWWLHSSVNPLRILIHGKNLRGARITAPAGIAASNLRTNESGTYLFADLALRSGVQAGRKQLWLATAEGRAKADFEVLPPLKRAGRFQGFSQDDVIYLLMPDRFSNGDTGNDDPEISRGLLDRGKPRYYHGGDLQGVIDRLPYLKELGITAIWLTPICDNVNHLNTRERYENAAITDYHGYGAVDFYAVEEHFGTLEKYSELVETAHQLGIKVIQDQVANHTGPFHPWVHEPPAAAWFHGTEANHLDNNWQTWTLMDPHASDTLRRPVLEGWFINILPDLNQEDREVARYLIQNSLWWVGVSGEDAIRQDTLPYVS
ncbi:MAG TPA: alpha-amylase family glycosyl hydrolase, partial [Acidobacteriota bacterium]